MNEINWSDITQSEINLLNSLDATFIAAPRVVSDARLLQMIKKYLPKGNIVLGVANENYILGFENQPQFSTLKIANDHKLISKVNNSNSLNKIAILRYNQSDVSKIYDSVKFQRVILVNGSWLYSFHLRPEYQVLNDNNIPLKFVSPFADEEEMVNYAKKFNPQIPKPGMLLNDKEMICVANDVAKNSFDNSFQTGVSLGIKQGEKYILVDSAYNTVVPYITYAWHNGASREKYKCMPGDLNHYDAIHAEVMLILQSQKRRYDTKGSTIFINLLPCPNCAKMLCEFDFDKIVYVHDHSNGYAVELLEKAGKVVRRTKITEEG